MAHPVYVCKSDGACILCARTALVCVCTRCVENRVCTVRLVVEGMHRRDSGVEDIIFCEFWKQDVPTEEDYITLSAVVYQSIMCNILIYIIIRMNVVTCCYSREDVSTKTMYIA